MQPQSMDIRLFWWAYWLYLASFLLFTVYGATRGRKVGRVANVAIGVGFVLQTVGIVWRWKVSGHVPMANMYEYASLLSWMAVLSYLYIEFRYRKTIVGSFVAPVVVAVMTCASMLPKEISQQLMPALQSYWLAIHVSLAALGEGAFAVALAVSIMYLVKEKRSGGLGLRKAHASMRTKGQGIKASQRQMTAAGAGTGSGGIAVLDLDDPMDDAVESLMENVRKSPKKAKRGNGDDGDTVLPSLRLLDEINYRAVAIGYPLFTIGALFAGAIWAYEAWGSFWSWDPKEVGALIIWLFYTAYLHARLQRGWSGRRAAWLSIAGFAIVILSFLGNLWLSGNHAYT
jgi:cytochrome c-type biogenesis protein CcsB